MQSEIDRNAIVGQAQRHVADVEANLKAQAQHHVVGVEANLTAQAQQHVAGVEANLTAQAQQHVAGVEARLTQQAEEEIQKTKEHAAILHHEAIKNLTAEAQAVFSSTTATHRGARRRCE